MIHGPINGHAMTLAALIAALLAAPALAGGHPDRPRLDTNGDGRIDFAEIQAARPDFTVEKFNAADANRDGQLSEDEWKSGRGKSGHGKRHRYGNLDADKDGNYTLEELRTAHPDLSQEEYASFDTDRDGSITRDEAKRSIGARLFENMDKDGDGGVSLQEMQAVRSSMTQEKFSRMDSDGNGLLSKEEMRAGHGKHRGRGDGPQVKPVEPPSGN